MKHFIQKRTVVSSSTIFITFHTHLLFNPLIHSYSKQQMRVQFSSGIPSNSKRGNMRSFLRIVNRSSTDLSRMIAVCLSRFIISEKVGELTTRAPFWRRSVSPVIMSTRDFGTPYNSHSLPWATSTTEANWRMLSTIQDCVKPQRSKANVMGIQ